MPCIRITASRFSSWALVAICRRSWPRSCLLRGLLWPSAGSGRHVNGLEGYIRSFVGHNGWAEVIFAQSARKHKIGRARVRQMFVAPRAVVEVPSSSPELADRLLIVGDDDSGRALEVVALVADDGVLLVIHAMDLREKYRALYEDGEQS